MEYIQGKPRSQIVFIESSLEEKIEPIILSGLSMHLSIVVNWKNFALPMPGMLPKADHPIIREIF
jgi:hypothetical protein